MRIFLQSGRKTDYPAGEPLVGRGGGRPSSPNSLIPLPYAYFRSKRFSLMALWHKRSRGKCAMHTDSYFISYMEIVLRTLMHKLMSLSCSSLSYDALHFLVVTLWQPTHHRRLLLLLIIVENNFPRTPRSLATQAAPPRVTTSFSEDRRRP